MLVLAMMLGLVKLPLAMPGLAMPGLAMPGVPMLGLADRAHTLAPCEADVRLALVVPRPTQSHWPKCEPFPAADPEQLP